MKIRYISIALFLSLMASVNSEANSMETPSQISYVKTAGTVNIMGIYEIVRGIISDKLGIDESYIHLESNIYWDLGADSLDMCEIITICEDKFACEIPFEEAKLVQTVYDLCELIQKHELNIFNR